ncbi:hypothetical protein EON64_17470, partial [archaeon]
MVGSSRGRFAQPSARPAFKHHRLPRNFAAIRAKMACFVGSGLPSICSDHEINGVGGWTCRILSKQPYGSSQVYADIICLTHGRRSPSLSPSSSSPDTSTESECSYIMPSIEYASLIVYREEIQTGDIREAPAAFMMGDVVVLKRGEIIKSQNAPDNSGHHRMVISLSSYDVEVIEEWDMEADGDFVFSESTLQLIPQSLWISLPLMDFNSALAPLFIPPRLAVQCSVHTIHATIQRLKEILAPIFGSENPTLTIRPSSITHTALFDCLVLVIQPNPEVSRVSQKAVIHTISRDKQLEITRIFSLACKESMYTHVSLTIPPLIQHLRQAWTSLPSIPHLSLAVHPRHVQDTIQTCMKYKRWRAGGG